MADTLKFGPEWLRALSDGNSVTSPPPSPAGIPKYKLAENRYGREEMLALYVPNTKLPESLREFPAVVHEKALQPLALIPLSEDEQRLMSQSVNSTAVLRLMGRGGGPMLRGGRGGGDRGRGRGRGRGEGGFFQRTASFDEEGFGRGRTHGRGEAWEESDKRFERGGFGRAYEDAPTSPRREYSRSMSSDNWRDLKARGAEEEEPEGDWRRAGPRDKLVSGSRASWREARDRGYDYHYDDYHKSPREFEDRPYGRSRNSGSWEEEDGLPDWAKDGAEDEDIGTFDASGAFMTLKDAAELEEREKKGDRNDTEKKDEEEESNKPNGAQKEKESKDPSKLDPKRTEKRDKSKSSSPKPQRAQDSDRESVSSSRSEKSDKSSSSKRSKSNEEADSKPNNIDQKVEEVAENILRENHVTVEPVKEASPPEEPTPPSEQMENHEEVQFDHLEKAAEHLVATWTAEEDAKSDNKAKVESGSVPQDHEDANSWFYRDPQGDLQGPFSSTEMREWFSAGYFTMTLLVKRGCDESFHPLGELIKRWGRVPFLPGPTPPPLQNTGTSSPHQQMAPPVQPGIVQHPQPQGSPQPAGSPEMMAAGATGASGQVDHLKLQQMLLQQQMFFRQLQMQQMIAMLQQQEGFNKLSPQQQQAMIYQALAQQPPPTPQQLMKLPPMPATSAPQPASAPQQQPPSLSPREGEQPGGQGHPAFHRSMSTPNGAAMPSFHRSMSQPGGLDDPAAMWAGQGPPPPVTSGGWTQGTSVWDIETPKQPPSLEDIQRQDLERQHREQEQREAEERRRQEEELQRQKEEEERRQREEEERRKVEMERQKEMERQRIADQIRREQEEARRREEEERRKEEERRRQEEDRRRQDEEERKRREIEEMERKRAEEIMRRQKAEEMRRHQQEALRRMQQEQMANMQLPASAQWGTMNNQLPSSSSGPSLAEIQQLEAEQQRKEQEEHQRRMEMQRHLVALQQQQQQQAKSWTQQKAAAQPSGPMSLRDIQQEQARQLERERQKQQNTPKPHKPASVPLATAAVWTGASQASNWAAEGAWGRAAQGQGFWEDAMVISNKKMPAVNNNAGFPALSTPNNSNVNTNKNNKAAKSKKDEESVQRLFRATKPKDDFTVWCEKALCGMHTSVDIPTFIAFLQDVESPYEVHDYVRSYLGETKEATEFAKQFLERRSKYKNQLKQQDQEEEIMWGPAPAINPNNNKAYSNCVEDPESAASKQLKKKKKMQKLDASILGFTVHAAPDRVNIGQIESAPFE